MLKEKIRRYLLRKRKYTAYIRIREKTRHLANRINGKNKRRKDEYPRWCYAPWKEAVINCDGNVLCGCALAYALYPLGNINQQSLKEIWNGKRYRKLRKKVVKNPDNFFLCRQCDLNVPVPMDKWQHFDKQIKDVPLPKILHIEPTVRCNLKCASCVLPNLYADRKEHFMSLDTFKKIIDETKNHLEYLGLFNYGETFIHPDAAEMIRYARETNPGLFIHISTNGHFFSEKEKQKQILLSGFDELLFSIDGASQETYGKYRINGSFEKAFKALKEMAAMKKSLGLQKPKIIWRYILFEWNDSDEEMNKARKMAKEAGVDKFCWLLTTYPEEGYSRRFAPGTDDYENIKDELF
ncbi:MAG: SPASM domain-containing protein [Acidobacteria bacterium]|nr:SPASM domain-containing protein [Acidobacteriota bacterium]